MPPSKSHQVAQPGPAALEGQDPARVLQKGDVFDFKIKFVIVPILAMCRTSLTREPKIVSIISASKGAEAGFSIKVPNSLASNRLVRDKRPDMNPGYGGHKNRLSFPVGASAHSPRPSSSSRTLE